MKFLYFLRHGKAEAPQFDQEDRDRRLTSSGQRSATAMGNHARERGFRIDVVLTSTARRTAETTELFLAAFGQSVPVRQLTGLYLASPEEILAHVAELDDATDSVVIIGHNPGLSELAIMLVASGPAPARSLLAR
ncbi:MAG: histidine phosphatase family protein, partial [Alphaproteobacteria bacterium]